MNVIVNNTVISNLALVNELDLLRKLVGKVYVTPEVVEEIEDGIAEGHNFQNRAINLIEEGEWLLVTELESRELEIYSELSSKMGIGEASCLAIALTRKWSFLTDDKRARKFAIKHNITLSGSYGVLISAIENGILSRYEANELLQMMRRNRYHSPYPDVQSYFRFR